MSTDSNAGQTKNMDPYWKCGKCGHTLRAPTPPEKCPSCNENCLFKDVFCYTPDCGGHGTIDPRI